MTFAIPALLLLAVQTAQPPDVSLCERALTAAPDAATAELCSAERLLQDAAALRKDSPEQHRLWERAKDQLRRAVAFGGSREAKHRAYQQLVELHEAGRLNDPAEMEAALRELIAFQPDDRAAIGRLVKQLEGRGLFEAAEEILLAARYRQPQDVEVYRQLSQFYARRVTALHGQARAQERRPGSAPAQADEHGVYQIGGSLTPPPRIGVPRYPADALAAGVQGAVAVEVVVDGEGIVRDASVVRSIPMLDEAALQAVREWRFEPTIVNGVPVPVRMNLTVNFTPR